VQRGEAVEAVVEDRGEVEQRAVAAGDDDETAAGPEHRFERLEHASGPEVVDLDVLVDDLGG
jgi:hypothetical protein